MMKNKDRKAILSSAYHEFSIHRRLLWLVSFLRFAIPCCDFPHDELSWRKSWDDDLNLEVIQQLYILTASFAPEHRINIQWNQSCQHDRRHLLFSRVSNEIQGISNRIVRMRDISLLCSIYPTFNLVPRVSLPPWKRRCPTFWLRCSKVFTMHYKRFFENYANKITMITDAEDEEATVFARTE